MTTAHTRSCNRTGNAEPGPTQTFFFEDVAIKIHRKNTFKIDNLFSKKTRRQYAIMMISLFQSAAIYSIVIGSR